nr:unnamed protein product [Digitaria exilis]CAB3504562.1 unnamed protein product [Digitaria exilis]
MCRRARRHSDAGRDDQPGDEAPRRSRRAHADRPHTHPPRPAIVAASTPAGSWQRAPTRSVGAAGDEAVAAAQWLCVGRDG